MFATKEGREMVLEYLAQLNQERIAYERELGDALNEFCTQPVVENSQVLKVRGESLCYVDLVRIFALLHFNTPRLCEHVMRRPNREDEGVVKDTIAISLQILDEVGIGYQQPSVEMLAWLQS